MIRFACRISAFIAIIAGLGCVEVVDEPKWYLAMFFGVMAGILYCLEIRGISSDG